MLDDRNRCDLLFYSFFSSERMAGHAFSTLVTPTPEQWASVPGLSAIQASPVQVLVCSNGCGYSDVFGCDFWVDFKRKLIQRDTQTTACTHGKGGSSDASTLQTKSRVRHDRVDFTGLIGHIGLRTTDCPRPAAAADEFLLECMPADKRLTFSEGHVLAPTSWGGHVAALETLGMRLMVAMSSALYARVSVPGAEPRGRIRRSVILASASSKADDAVPMETIVRNLVIISTTLRGLQELPGHVQQTFWSVYGGSGQGSHYKPWMQQVTELFRADLAEVRTAFTNPDYFFADLAPRLDSSPFAVLGAAAAQQNRVALAAFWRAERARYDAIAKACGLKPASARVPGTGGAGGGAGAAASAAVPSPVRGADTAGGGGGGDGSGAGGGGARNRGKGRGKQKRSTSNAGAPEAQRRKQGAPGDTRKAGKPGPDKSDD